MKGSIQIYIWCALSVVCEPLSIGYIISYLFFTCYTQESWEYSWYSCYTKQSEYESVWEVLLAKYIHVFVKFTYGKPIVLTQLHIKFNKKFMHVTKGFKLYYSVDIVLDLLSYWRVFPGCDCDWVIPGGNCWMNSTCIWVGFETK